VIGPGPLLGLWIAAGFSGHGFQHGPVVGRLMAEMITGQEPTVDVSALSFERFERGQLVAEGHVV
jgi:sarcosine oxidase subunit beta